MRRATFSTLLTAGALLAAGSATAGGWYQEPSVRLRTGFDDNIRLRSSDPQEDFVTTLQGDGLFGYRTETESAALKLKAEANQYQQQDGLNNENLFADLNLDHKGERNSFGLLTSLHRDTTLQSELETTGRVDDNLRVTRQLLQPSFEHSFAERWVGSVGASYSEVEYEDRVGSSLTDYRYVTAQTALQYRVSEDRSFTGTLFATRYTPTDFDFISRGQGVSFGWQERFSPSLTGSLSVGARKDKSERTLFGLQTEDESSGTQFDAALEKSWQRWRLNLNLGRSTDPSGDGSLIQRDRLGGTASYDWNERTRLIFNANYLDIQQTNDLVSLSRNDRRYLTFAPGIEWRVERNWTARFDYRYRQNRFLDQGDEAEGNALFVSISYLWPSPLGSSGQGKPL